VIRVVRTTRAQRISEESYRVVVDELPDAQRLRGGNVALVLRQSIPAFFLGEKAAAPQLSWTAKAVKGQLVLQADNQGGRRVRISRLRVNDGSGSVSFGTGLVGYVLAGSHARFTRPSASLKGPSITISADGDAGALQARVPLDH
jgi:fimbrial chaperone protein